MTTPPPPKLESKKYKDAIPLKSSGLTIFTALHPGPNSRISVNAYLSGPAQRMPGGTILRKTAPSESGNVAPGRTPSEVSPCFLSVVNQREAPPQDRSLARREVWKAAASRTSLCTVTSIFL